MLQKEHQLVSNDDSHDKNVTQQQIDYTCYENCLICCGNTSACLKIWLPCFCCCCSGPIIQVNTSKAGILQQFGRFRKVLDSGLHLINPVSQSVLQVDLKTNVLTLQPQQVITKDNVSLKISTIVYYRIVNAYKIVYKLGNSIGQIKGFIKQMAFSVLRTVIGQNIFQQLVENRIKIADQIEKYVSASVAQWGLFVENIFIKDLILSQQTKRNLQSAAIQKRVSQANIISAQADVRSAEMMKATSEQLNSKSAMQIRYLETIQQMVNKSRSNLLFVSLKN